VPFVLVEEIKNAFKCFVVNINAFVHFLQLVLIEQTAIEVRNSADFNFYILFLNRFIKAFME
jgi:hypothetical protein